VPVVRVRPGRHGHRRRLGQRRCPDHLLHRRDPGQPGASPGRRRRCRRGRDGRVPLLHRPPTRLGLAGTDPGAHRHPVPVDQRHHGSHRQDRARARGTHGTANRRGHEHHTPGAARVRVPGDTAARIAGCAVGARPGAGVHRALHPGRGDGLGAVAHQSERAVARREGGVASWPSAGSVSTAPWARTSDDS
jgi:hypothetical protein